MFELKAKSSFVQASLTYKVTSSYQSFFIAIQVDCVLSIEKDKKKTYHCHSLLHQIDLGTLRCRYIGKCPGYKNLHLHT